MLAAALTAAVILIVAVSSVLASPSCSLKISDFTNTDATNFTTASTTLNANKLYLLFAVTKVSTGTANTATATSTGATWVLVDVQTTGANTEKIAVLRTMVTSDQTGTINIDYAGQTQTAQLWTLVECTPVDTSGTNGSGAVVTSNKNSVTGGTSLTCTFAAYSSSNNRPVVGAGSQRNAPFDTVPWTNINGDNTGPDTADIQVSWRDATDQTAATFGQNISSNIGCIGVEVKAAGGVGQRRTFSFVGSDAGSRSAREDY